VPALACLEALRGFGVNCHLCFAWVGIRPLFLSAPNRRSFDFAALRSGWHFWGGYSKALERASAAQVAFKWGTSTARLKPRH